MSGALKPEKEYLGDGVYVEIDGDALVLTSENGRQVLNRIVLEDAVYVKLIAYVARLPRATWDRVHG